MKYLFIFIFVISLKSIVHGANVPIVLFSYDLGWIGTKNSNSLSSGFLMSNYGIKNIYFKDCNDVNTVSNNIWALCVFEYNNGTETEIPGFIYSRVGNVDGVMWTPNTNQYGINIGFGTTFQTSATTAVCVQFFGSTITPSGSAGSITISGNSGNLTMTQLQNYAGTYPNVTTAIPSSKTSTSVVWGGAKLASTSSFTVSEAGIYYSTTGDVQVGSGSQFQTMTFNNSTAQVNFSATASGLSPNTTYYLRAYVKVGSVYYQGPLEAFTTCPGVPTSGGAGTGCAGSSASISATGVSGGTLRWFATNSSTTVLGTGANFTTPTLSNATNAAITTTYYVADSNASCASSRTAINVTINPKPSIVSQTVTTPSGTAFSISPSNGGSNVVPSGTTYVWTVATNNNVSGQSNEASAQSTISQTLMNLSGANQNVVYTVTPTGGSGVGSCQGTPFSATATVTTALSVPASTTVTINNQAELSDVTLGCSSILIVASNGKLNVTGTLTNNGTVQILSGGILKYGSVTANTSCGGGIFIKEQNLTPNRNFYIGATTTSTTVANFGSGATLFAWNEVTKNFDTQTSQSYQLTPGKGFVYTTGGSAQTITQTGSYVNSVSFTGLTKTPGTYVGFHLMANPFTAPLDLHKVYGTNGNSNPNTSNLNPTAWVRTKDGNTWIFETYNTITGVGASTIQGNVSGMRYIPSMQSFWVCVASGSNTGNIGYDRSMTVTNTTGNYQLKNSSPLSALIRINVTNGSQKDQFVAALSPNALSDFDVYDSEKMFSSGVVQIYSPNSGRKLVINTMRDNKSKISMPITIECPVNGWYGISLQELNLENGVAIIEDKLEGIFRDLSLDSSFQFYANAGVLVNRFVLHFQLPTVIDAVGPSQIDDLIQESANPEISIEASSSGKVVVAIQSESINEVSKVRILSMSGQIIDQFDQEGPLLEFDVNQPAGVYYIEVQNGQIRESKKVFIQ